MRCVISTESVTYAMKGRQLLAANGMISKIVKLSPSQTGRGCGYGLEIECPVAAHASGLLSRGGVKYGETVRINDNERKK